MTRDISARSRPPASLAWLIRFWSSIPDFVRSGVLVAAALAVGLIAWSGEPRLLPAAMLFPALWALAPTRFCAALVAEGYFLVASRGLPQGVANFYGSGFEAGIVLWIAASSLFVPPATGQGTRDPLRDRGYPTQRASHRHRRLGASDHRRWCAVSGLELVWARGGSDRLARHDDEISADRDPDTWRSLDMVRCDLD